MLPIHQTGVSTFESGEIQSFLIVLESGCSSQVMFRSESEVEFQQLLWLISALEAHGADTLEDALRMYLDARYYDV